MSYPEIDRCDEFVIVRLVKGYSVKMGGREYKMKTDTELINLAVAFQENESKRKRDAIDAAMKAQESK